MKTAVFIAVCLVACLVSLEAQEEPGKLARGRPGPLSEGNGTRPEGGPRPKPPPGGPGGFPPGNDVNGTVNGTVPQFAPPPGGPRGDRPVHDVNGTVNGTVPRYPPPSGGPPVHPVNGTVNGTAPRFPRFPGRPHRRPLPVNGTGGNNGSAPFPRPPPGGPQGVHPVNGTVNGTAPRFPPPPGGQQGVHPVPNGNETVNSTVPRYRRFAGGPHTRPAPLNGTEGGNNSAPFTGQRFPGRHGFNKTKFFNVRYIWSRQVDADTLVTEGAGIRNDSKIVYLKSRDPKLESKGYNRSCSTYDFTNDTAIVVYSIESSSVPCFVEEIDLTYAEVIAKLAARNGSIVPSAKKVSLTAEPLSDEEIDNLKNSLQAVKFACQHQRIYRINSTSDDDDDQPGDDQPGDDQPGDDQPVDDQPDDDQPAVSNEKTVQFFNMDYEYFVTYPKSSTTPHAGRRPDKGDKGGRGGKGRKGRKGGKGDNGGRRGVGPNGRKQ